MQPADRITRVIVVVLDGLRADAIPLFPLPHLRRLARAGAYTLAGRTVSPSITHSAMASLLTGVPPDVHGIVSERLLAPRPGIPLTPLPHALRTAGLGLRAYRGELPPFTAGIAMRITKRLGFEATFAGRRADEVLESALPSLLDRQPGVSLLHWLDADRAGHASGWGSPGYIAAAQHLDAALGRLVEATGVVHDPSTLLIAMADHGGGGATERDHNSTHPLDLTIPIILAGGQVLPQVLGYGASLLDIPATICWALGVRRPPTWGGRPLVEAFRRWAPAVERAA